MSRSSLGAERRVLPEGRLRGMSESDEDERQAMRPRRVCRPVLPGARTAPQSVSRTFAADAAKSQPALKPFGGALRC
jgi:hypothetical protein